MVDHATSPTKDATPKKPRRRQATAKQGLLTVKQIEDEYGHPVRSTHSLIARGLLPTVRFIEGGQFWIRRRDWEALLDRSTERLTG